MNRLDAPVFTSLGLYQLLLIVLGTVALTLAALWARDSYIEWRDARKYREQRARQRRERHAVRP